MLLERGVSAAAADPGRALGGHARDMSGSELLKSFLRDVSVLRESVLSKRSKVQVASFEVKEDFYKASERDMTILEALFFNIANDRDLNEALLRCLGDYRLKENRVMCLFCIAKASKVKLRFECSGGLLKVRCSYKVEPELITGMALDLSKVELFSDMFSEEVKELSVERNVYRTVHSGLCSIFRRMGSMIGTPYHANTSLLDKVSLERLRSVSLSFRSYREKYDL